MIDRTPTTRIIPNFTPVPRKYRHDGWTPERQRGFIDALAETGSVRAAAHRVNMTPEGAYHLRRQPHADGFRAAWEAALNHGVTRLADIALERAIDGVLVPVYSYGQLIGERRVYNDRLLMFMLRHHKPERYGPLKPLPPGTKSPETLAREAAATAEVESEAQAAARLASGEKIAALYRSRIALERRAREAGNTASADFYVRQLTQLEVILEIGGVARQWIEQARDQLSHAPPPPTGVGRALAAIRAEVWEGEQ